MTTQEAAPRPGSPAALRVAQLHVLPVAIDLGILVTMFIAGTRPHAELASLLAALALALAIPEALYIALIVAAINACRRGVPNWQARFSVLAVVDMIAGALAMFLMLPPIWPVMLVKILAQFGLGPACMITSAGPGQRI